MLGLKAMEKESPKSVMTLSKMSLVMIANVAATPALESDRVDPKCVDRVAQVNPPPMVSGYGDPEICTESHSTKNW